MDNFLNLCFIFIFVLLSCRLVITCWERADLLAFLCVMFLFDFVTLPYGVQDQAWYLIVSCLFEFCILYFN